jgi:hypothetical protein
VQQETSVEQAPSIGAQAALQKHAPPAVQPTSLPKASSMRQESPAQHSPPPAVHTWKFSEQVGGAVQTPLSGQVSALSQQSVERRHACPVAEQVGPPPAVQVPLVAPGGTSQASGAQQSAVTVQAPVSGTHGARQVTPSQMPEQHCAALAQELPFGAQSGAQVPATQLPKQHGVAPLQAWPSRAQPPPGSFAAQAQPTSVT